MITIDECLKVPVDDCEQVTELLGMLSPDLGIMRVQSPQFPVAPWITWAVVAKKSEIPGDEYARLLEAKAIADFTIVLGDRLQVWSHFVRYVRVRPSERLVYDGVDVWYVVVDGAVIEYRKQER